MFSLIPLSCGTCVCWSLVKHSGTYVWCSSALVSASIQAFFTVFILLQESEAL